MRILLVGEYNRSHASLKDGFVSLGHEATVVGMTDGFKKVDVDIEIKHYYKKKPNRYFRSALVRLFKIDLHSKSVIRQLKKHKSKLQDSDVVQFINESSFLATAKAEKKIFDMLASWNGKTFLLSCGTDYPSVKFAMDKKFRYSILTSYFEGKIDKSHFSLGLKYLKPDFQQLHHHIYGKIHGVISNDLDYALPLENHEKHLGMIPHVINTEKLKFTQLKIGEKIIIFHGINRRNYFKKGNDIFEKALAEIEKRFRNKVNIITIEDVPYSVYIKAFDSAHILLDQIYAYDQGYNALEAMAKGKVVFTGAEKEWLEYYNLKEDEVAINALPDVEAIVNKLEWLITNPEKLIEIAQNARNFVEREHDYIVCAKKYLEMYRRF
ncbi:MAG: glycosyltransferase [Bacteroidota bacterium]